MNTLLLDTGTQTVSNKTIDGDNNTISNLDVGNEVDWASATDVDDRSATPAAGDKLLLFEAGVGLRKIDWTDLPSGGASTLSGSTGATDNALLRADGTGGSTVQNSGVTVDDLDNLSLPYTQVATLGAPAQTSTELRFVGSYYSVGTDNDYVYKIKNNVSSSDPNTRLEIIDNDDTVLAAFDQDISGNSRLAIETINGLTSLAVAGSSSSQVLKVQNTRDNASNDVVTLVGNSKTTSVNNDEAFINLQLYSNGSALNFTYGRIKWLVNDTSNETGGLVFQSNGPNGLQDHLSIVDGVVNITPDVSGEAQVSGQKIIDETEVTGAFVGTTDTQTVTNKRVNPRTSSTTSTTTLTPDLSTANVFYVTAQAAALTIAAPTGSPVIGETISINIIDNGTARALTFNATYKAMGATLPTTTTISKWLTVTAQYNGTNWLTTFAEEQ